MSRDVPYYSWSAWAVNWRNAIVEFPNDHDVLVLPVECVEMVGGGPLRAAGEVFIHLRNGERRGPMPVGCGGLRVLGGKQKQ